MTIKDLNSSLSDDINAFQSFIETHFEEGSHNPVDSGELAEFGKQVFYALDATREKIIDYLENN